MSIVYLIRFLSCNDLFVENLRFFAVCTHNRLVYSPRNGNGNGNKNISNAPPTVDRRRIT